MAFRAQMASKRWPKMGYLGWIMFGWLALPLILLYWVLLGCWWLLLSTYQVGRLGTSGLVRAYRKAQREPPPATDGGPGHPHPAGM
jgi:hypothetical protein